MKKHIALAAVLSLFGLAATSDAQVVYESYYAPSVPVTSYYSAPVTSYAAPVTSYYAAPVTSYYAPAATAYYAPTTAYYAPATTAYYAPAATTAYYAPVTSYYAPAVSTAYYPGYYYPSYGVRRGLFGRLYVTP